MKKIFFYKLILLTGITLLLTFTFLSRPTHAQWPPFNFRLTPSYADGKITYNLIFSEQVDWAMSDVTIKIPLPEGTRFLEAGAESSMQVTFDGKEITFFTSTFNRSLRNAFFVVEVTEPDQTVFTTNAWISWKGDQPGDFLTDDFSFDITRQPLNWDRPSQSALELEAKAIVADNVIDYVIYPKHVGSQRMWDLTINMPLPEKTTLLEAQAPPPFETRFDGREISFFISEIEQQANIEPLKIKVSTENATSPFVVTHAWATWKNAGRSVGRRIEAQEDTRTGDLIVQLQASEQVVADTIGDVPFAGYDLASIALQEDGANLKINFYTAGTVDPVGEPLEFLLHIDSDCNTDTGRSTRSQGVDYRVRYRHNRGQAIIQSWDEEKSDWDKTNELENLVGGKTVAIWLPYNLIENDQQFCWLGQSVNRSQGFYPNPPSDYISNPNISNLNLFEGIKPIPESSAAQNPVNVAVQPSPPVTATPVALAVTSLTTVTEYLIQSGDTWRYLKGYGEASYPVQAWQQPEYDDSGWLSGPTTIGYGNSSDPVTVLEDMRNNYVSVFMRHTFNITDIAQVKSLTLEMDYDDGFVAYLNGKEVARRHLGKINNPVAYDTEATASHDAGNPEAIDLNSFTDLLLPGENVLAIQGHNQNPTSSDFSITPVLKWEYFSQPTTIERPTTAANNTSDNATIPVINERVNTTPLYGTETAVNTPSAIPVNTEISGKIAIPTDNGAALYDVHIFSVPEGQEIARIPNARQPNFRFDGQRLLINREGGGIENIYEYNLTDGLENKVSDAPEDSQPFYDPSGNRVAYGNSNLVIGADGNRHPFIFVQCSLLPPHQETTQQCRDIATFGILVPAGQTGEIWGTHPVWASNDIIVYKGCNSWAGFSACGIYSVPSASTKGFSNGFIPNQLTRDTSDTPTDSKGNLIAFMSNRDGNWESFVMNLDGTGLKNLSNSPDSDDGLPTISPDGNWVAFVSNRDGLWAVWAVPVAGGSAQKLFDLPASTTPWGEGERNWTNERISWGP